MLSSPKWKGQKPKNICKTEINFKLNDYIANSKPIEEMDFRSEEGSSAVENIFD